MKPILVSVFLFVPFALGARWYFVCETLHWCLGAARADLGTVEVDVAMPDGRDRTLGFVPYARGDVGAPRDADTRALLDTLAALVAAQPDYALRIEGPVLAGEHTDGDVGFRDLGIARAAALASGLQRRGIDGSHLVLGSFRPAAGAPAAPRLAFEPRVPKAMSDGLPIGEILVDSLAFLGLRFETNSTALRPSDEFAAYATELVEALNARPQLRLTLIGHTDDQAESAHNDSLGRWRAEAVARYLTQRGLSTPIAVESRGEREPLAPNDHPEGRYLNRRVEARIR